MFVFLRSNSWIQREDMYYLNQVRSHRSEEQDAEFLDAAEFRVLYLAKHRV